MFMKIFLNSVNQFDQHFYCSCSMLDEILPLQLITAKLGGSIVSLEIEITSSMRRMSPQQVFSISLCGIFYLPIDTR